MIWRPNVTVATVVFSAQRFLMVQENGVYNQPAGHLEEGESLQEAALREILEETAWSVALTGFLGASLYRSPHNHTTYLRHTFTATPLHHHPEQALDDDIQRALWLTRQEVLTLNEEGRLRSPLVLKAIEDYQSGKCFPLELVSGTGRLAPT